MLKIQLKIQFNLSIRNEFGNIEGFEINCEEVNDNGNFIFKVIRYIDVYLNNKISERLVFDENQIFDSLEKATDWIKEYILDESTSLQIYYHEFVRQINLIFVFIMNTSIDVNNEGFDRIFD